MPNLSNYPPGCSAADYERWAGFLEDAPDCDDDPTAEEMADEYEAEGRSE